MEQTKQLKSYHGILVFIVTMLLIIPIATYTQRNWGMYGLAITQFALLLLGVLPAVMFKVKLREVFPIKKPLFRQVIGTLLIWLGSYLVVAIVANVLMYFFPEGFREVSNALQDAFTSIPMAVSFLIVAVMPAICEEALHRGFILYSLDFKSKWTKIITMGVIFGLFHLDVYRFLPTAILGLSLTYIMIETKNILLPAIFHFINNAVSLLATFASQSHNNVDTQAIEMSQEILSSTNIIGVLLIFIGPIIPFMLLGGVTLLKDRQHPINRDSLIVKKRIKPIWIALITSLIIIVSGVIIFDFSVFKMEEVFNINITMDINIESDGVNMPFNIEESGNYYMDLKLNSQRGLIDYKIINENDEEVFQTSAQKLTYSSFLQLEEGEYHVVVDFQLDKKIVEDLNLTGDLYEYSQVIIKNSIRKWKLW
ncbi:UNVERIFIED_CONTAM: membrane protease YdiL (CAAX protease family) [Acetivibrio alkalicellulosi]